MSYKNIFFIVIQQLVWIFPVLPKPYSVYLVTVLLPPAAFPAPLPSCLFGMPGQLLSYLFAAVVVQISGLVNLVAKSSLVFHHCLLQFLS